jgi:ATP-dependent DNA ligase
MTTSKPKKKGTQVWLFTFTYGGIRGSIIIDGARDGLNAYNKSDKSVTAQYGNFTFTGAFRLK